VRQERVKWPKSMLGGGVGGGGDEVLEVTYTESTIRVYCVC